LFAGGVLVFSTTRSICGNRNFVHRNVTISFAQAVSQIQMNVSTVFGMIGIGAAAAEIN